MMDAGEIPGSNSNKGFTEQQQLDAILLQAMDSIDSARRDIFDIFAQSHKQYSLLQIELNGDSAGDGRKELVCEKDKHHAINQIAEHYLRTTNLVYKTLQRILKGDAENIPNLLGEDQPSIAIELERRKLARDLHDGAAQNLASMIVRLDIIQRLGEKDIQHLQEEINSIKQIGVEGLNEIRRLLFELRSPRNHQDDFGRVLGDYLNKYAIRYDLDIDFGILGERQQYSEALQSALYRIVQEAVSNARKHSGKKHIMVRMENRADCLTLIIKDEGRGFDAQRAIHQSENYGIIGMRERVELLGGKMELITSPGQGTEVIITMPLEGDAINGAD